jgi:hypothetical protein
MQIPNVNDKFLWIFQDTLVGSLKPDGSRGSHCMPHNSIGVMTKSHNSANGSQANGWSFEHYTRGECSPASANVSNPHNGFFAPANRSRWFWTENGLVAGVGAGARAGVGASAGAVLGTGGTIFMFAQTMTLPCTIGCSQVGIGVIEINTVTDPSIAVNSNASVNPLEWEYKVEELGPPYYYEEMGLSWPAALVRVDANSSDGSSDSGSGKGASVGAGGARDSGGYYYLLGRDKSFAAVMGRIPVHALNTGSNSSRWSKLEFWVKSKDQGQQGEQEHQEEEQGPADNGQWVRVPSLEDGGIASLTDHLLPLFADAPPETSLVWLPSPVSRWLILNIPFGSSALCMRIAPKLTGPWSEEVAFFNITTPWVDPHGSAFSYSPKIHAEMASSADELIITYMSNADGKTVAADTLLYVPQILRVQIS